MLFSLKKMSQVACAALAISLSFHVSANEPKLNAEQQKLKKVYESNDIRGGLIGLCKAENAKTKNLSTAEVSKLCTCTIDGRGRESLSEQWALQSAANVKDEKKIQSIMASRQNAFKKCLGPELTQKVDQMAKDAYAAALAEQQKQQPKK